MITNYMTTFIIQDQNIIIQDLLTRWSCLNLSTPIPWSLKTDQIVQSWEKTTQSFAITMSILDGKKKALMIWDFCIDSFDFQSPYSKSSKKILEFHSCPYKYLVLMFPLSAWYFCICSGAVGWTASIERKQDNKVSLTLIRCPAGFTHHERFRIYTLIYT